MAAILSRARWVKIRDWSVTNVQHQSTYQRNNRHCTSHIYQCVMPWGLYRQCSVASSSMVKLRSRAWISNHIYGEFRVRSWSYYILLICVDVFTYSWAAPGENLPCYNETPFWHCYHCIATPKSIKKMQYVQACHGDWTHFGPIMDS